MTLGTEPDRLDVVLVRDSDFIESIETMSPDLTTPLPWPGGAVVSIELGTSAGTVMTWAATVNGHVLSWTVQSDQVNAAIDAHLTAARLWYTNGTVRVPLAIGSVSVYG